MCDAAETGRGMFPWHIFKMPARVRGRAPSGPSVADCAACFCACRIAVPETALLREPMRPEHLRHRHDWLCGERVVRTYAFVYQGRPGGPCSLVGRGAASASAGGPLGASSFGMRGHWLPGELDTCAEPLGVCSPRCVLAPRIRFLSYLWMLPLLALCCEGRSTAVEGGLSWDRGCLSLSSFCPLLAS